MMASGRILVDSNVLLDILAEDPQWLEWSAAQLEHLADSHTFIINPVIYSEISIGFSRIEDLEEALPQEFITRLQIPWEALFLAGKCFLRYRRAGGTKRSPLPDFFIGAHAAIENIPLLTRDGNRYRTYFPQLQLISPES